MRSNSISYHLSKRSVNLADPWHYDNEVPNQMRKIVSTLALEKDGFGSSWGNIGTNLKVSRKDKNMLKIFKRKCEITNC